MPQAPITDTDEFTETVSLPTGLNTNVSVDSLSWSAIPLANRTRWCKTRIDDGVGRVKKYTLLTAPLASTAVAGDVGIIDKYGLYVVEDSSDPRGADPVSPYMIAITGTTKRWKHVAFYAGQMGGATPNALAMTGSNLRVIQTASSAIREHLLISEATSPTIPTGSGVFFGVTLPAIKTGDLVRWTAQISTRDVAGLVYVESDVLTSLGAIVATQAHERKSINTLPVAAYSEYLFTANFVATMPYSAYGLIMRLNLRAASITHNQTVFVNNQQLIVREA
jgi:hypothetical protein